MSPIKGDLLIGRIALREGLITKEQLYDCLIAQERNSSKSLGAILVSRGYLKNEDIQRLLELQKVAMSEQPSKQSALLGQILIEKGLATEYQVHECLRLQGRLSDMGIHPIPLLGEIMMKRGYIKKDAVEMALQMQNLTLYSCPECGAAIAVGREGAAEKENYTCSKCGAEVPFLFVKMAAAVHEAISTAGAKHDLDLPEDVRAATRKAGNHFGKYILVEEIGRGGAGIVYRAWQKDSNRVVALKLLPHESDTAAGIRTPYGDAEDVKRFYNETRAIAELVHPNIVPILDFGTVDNHFFYTMKFIEGATLDRVMRDGFESFAKTIRFKASEIPTSTSPSAHLEPLPSQKETFKIGARMLQDICRAVDFAHQRGIYHRDIKPSNIIIDKVGHPYVMDFGLAKVQRIGDSAYVKGVIMGTPYYMPPEQGSGDMERVDNLSDIYSLGAVLYEIISGYSPYAGKSTDEVLAKLQLEPPEPLEMIAPDLPEALRRIVVRAMARNKSERYQTATDMADDLQRFIDDVPLPLEPVGQSNSIWGILKQILGKS